MVPKKIHWNPLSKQKFTQSIFVEISQQDAKSGLYFNFELLTKMFCRLDSEIKAEEEIKQQQQTVEV